MISFSSNLSVNNCVFYAVLLSLIETKIDGNVNLKDQGNQLRMKN